MERGEIFMAQKLKQINDISIGDNLRKLRNAANLTQEQVVAQLQLRNLPTSRSVYSQIEAGTYNIRISELIALAEIFHTDFNFSSSLRTYTFIRSVKECFTSSKNLSLLNLSSFLIKIFFSYTSHFLII